MLAMRIYVGASLLAMRIYVGASLLAIAVRGSGYRLQASSYENSSPLAMRIYAGDAYLCRSQPAGDCSAGLWASLAGKLLQKTSSENLMQARCYTKSPSKKPPIQYRG